MIFRGSTLASIVLAASLGFGAASPANAVEYYLFDGDSSRGAILQNGTATGFNTLSRGYPVAITDTIWLGHRDNAGGAEYSLTGLPTGATSQGGGTITQLLDGGTDGTINYAATCCSGQNVVTVANSDWSDQRVLFNISFSAYGITFNTSSDTLYLSGGNFISQFSLSGQNIGSFSASGFLVGLAYDELSDSLWGWNRVSSTLDNYSLTGVPLSSTYYNVESVGLANPFGGEMRISTAVPGLVPEPATWAMMIGGFGLTGAAMRRRKLAVI